MVLILKYGFGYICIYGFGNLVTTSPLYYAFPVGSVYGFGMKRRTPTLSESATNIKILHKVINACLLTHC